MRSHRHIAALVIGLGVAQLVAWGTLYYAIAVIGESMRAELGVRESQLFGAFTWSMAISGLLAPWAGRKVDQYGGRAVLVASALVGALGFAVLARTHTFVGVLVGWSINGVSMAVGLYDVCFAALGQVQPQYYRRAVTGVTLIAGFASTVSWPASHFLLQSLGWRGLCDGYAVALSLCALIYLTVLPRAQVAAPQRTVIASQPDLAPPASVRRRARLLAWTFAGAALIGASMSAHMLSILKALGLPAEQAVWAASSVGAMQVLGRLLELAFGSKRHPVQLGMVTFSGVFASMLLLLTLSVTPWLVIAFVICYGIANGLLTIAKATLPVQMFGLRDVGSVLANFSMPSLITRALAPLSFAMISSALGTGAALLAMVAVGFATLVSYAATTRSAFTAYHHARDDARPIV
jgi:MFS family permease